MTIKTIPRVGYAMRQALMAAVAAPDLLKLLGGVDKPSDGLTSIIKQLDKLVKMKKPEKGETLPSLEGIYKALKKLEDKPEQVITAIKLLDKMYGKKDGEGKGKAKVPNLGNLPFFELLRGKPGPPMPGAAKPRPVLQAAVGGKPGTYEARLIRAGQALDKKNWMAKALQAAVSANAFEGIPLKVFSYGGEYGPVEYHLPLTDSDFAGSTVGNQVGYVMNATWDEAEQAVFGDICITDPNRRALIDSMLANGLTPPGLSIYCEGEMDDSGAVNKIARVHSMDLVTWPAAEGEILGERQQQLQAAFLGVLGAATDEEQVAPTTTPEGGENTPVEGAEPTANESVTGGTWKTERNSQLDFFTSLASFVREKIESGTEIEPAGVGDAYDKWTGAWEGSQDNTFEEFMSAFWENPENAGLLIKSEEEEPPPEEEVSPQASPGQPPAGATPAAPPAGVQQPLGLAPRQMSAASPSGGVQVMVNGERDHALENRLKYLEGRVGVVDSEAMVDQKLGGSGLPEATQGIIREEFVGRTISVAAVDGVIESHRKSIANLESGLAVSAAIGIEGQPLAGGANAQAAVNQILGLEPTGQ